MLDDAVNDVAGAAYGDIAVRVDGARDSPGAPGPVDDVAAVRLIRADREDYSATCLRGRIADAGPALAHLTGPARGPAATCACTIRTGVGAGPTVSAGVTRCAAGRHGRDHARPAAATAHG